MEIQATVVRDILYAASSYGAAYDSLCKMAGFRPEEMSDSDHRFASEKGSQLWSLLADITGDEQIGLRLGREMSISMLGMVGFLMQSSEDLEQVIEVFTRYGHLVSPMVSYRYTRSGDTAVVELFHHALTRSQYPRSARIRLDFNLSCTINYLRALSGRQLTPLAVQHEGGRIGVSAYNDIFGCTPDFEAAGTKLVFRAPDMDIPVMSRDKSLFDTFNGILAQKKEAQAQASCSQTLKQLLLMQFKGLIPAIDEAAAGLHMTTRSLQRKLLEEGTSYRQLTNEVKKELALHLMKNKNTRISEVAQVMGYSDLPAFRRAFKMWTHATPKSVKQQLQLEAANSAL